MIDDLKIIKKKYGEDMMHLCRTLFPTILETPGLLSSIMLSVFEPQKLLYKDIINNRIIDNFKNYIYTIYDRKINNTNNYSDKSPKELLDQAGYILYECKTEEEIDSFKKYYESYEELCTFMDNRLKKCHVFFAIKKNVEEIKREDFDYPDRQDEYGTSVISIQFTKDPSHTLSIKNRYNHTVKNPDATFSNNLDNIIEGLTEAFAKEYGLVQRNISSFEIPGYIQANDGKYYKYNYEFNNIYYCPNNIIIDNFKVYKYPKEKYIVMDYFILDLINKNIDAYDNYIADCFHEGINSEKIDKIKITKDNDLKKVLIIPVEGEDITIGLDNNNRITTYKNPNITKIRDYFLKFNKTLNKLDLPNLKTIGDFFLLYNNTLKELSLPKVKEIGDYFLNANRCLRYLDIPSALKIDNSFLYCNNTLQTLNLPNIKIIGDHFMDKNSSLKNIDAPKLEYIGNYFLYYNRTLVSFQTDKLVKAGKGFLFHNSFINIPYYDTSYNTKKLIKK